jgi:hypothetical protein
MVQQITTGHKTLGMAQEALAKLPKCSGADTLRFVEVLPSLPEFQAPEVDTMFFGITANAARVLVEFAEAVAAAAPLGISSLRLSADMIPGVYLTAYGHVGADEWPDLPDDVLFENTKLMTFDEANAYTGIASDDGPHNNFSRLDIISVAPDGFRLLCASKHSDEASAYVSVEEMKKFASMCGECGPDCVNTPCGGC